MKKNKLLIIGAILIISVILTTQLLLSSSQQQLTQIIKGLYIVPDTPINIPGTNNYTVIISVKDFDYKGNIYITAFYIPINISNANPALITPYYAYTKNGEIVYPLIMINNEKPLSINTSSLYYKNSSVLYNKNTILWKTPPVTNTVPISITFSPPKGYVLTVSFFVEMHNKYIRIGVAVI